MKKTKMLLSVLLAAVLLFSALPLTAFAEDETSAANDADIALQEELAESGAEDELADSGAEEDLAESGANYYLWVGNTRVTDANKDDILNDGGRAKFNPATSTLTLYEPTISDVYNDDYYGDYLIAFMDYMNLTIKGSYHMSSPVDARVGLIHDMGDNGNLTLDGDFSFLLKNHGVYASDIRIKSGSLYVKSDGGSYALYAWGDTFTIDSAVTHAEFIVNSDDENTSALKGNGGTVSEISSDLDLLTPRNYVKSTAYVEVGEVLPSGETVNAKHVVFENKSIPKYSVWLGDTRVTDYNKDDIFGDGRASYNPDMCVLSLDEPEINGYYADNNAGKTYQIYSETALMLIDGSYHMTQTPAQGEMTDYAVRGNNVHFYGKFQFNCSILIYGNMHIDSGTMTVYRSESAEAAIKCFNGDVIIDKNVGYVHAQGIRTPDGNTDYSQYHHYVSANGRWVFYDSRTVTYYDLWLGTTQVSSLNCDDIFGDGTASYDGDTLTLNDPDIEGFYTDSYWKTSKIFWKDYDLTIKGSYDMDSWETECNYFLLGRCDAEEYGGSLCLEGDFSFFGLDAAILTQKSIYIDNGTLVAEALREKYGYGIQSNNGDITIYPGVTYLHTYGYNCGMLALRHNIIVADTLTMTTPENGKIRNGMILESDESETASTVIFERVEYNLWLGETQVTYANRNDILNDGGKAKFDPEACLLTLKDPVIPGFNDDKGDATKIYAEGMDLTVKGSYHMSLSDSIPVAGIFIDGGLTLDGDFAFYGDFCGIFASKELRFDGGSIVTKGLSAEDSYGTFLNEYDSVKIGENVALVDAQGNTFAFGNYISYGLGHCVTTPKNACIDTKEGWTWIYEADGETTAKHVVIQNGYNLWLGSTRVTPKNADDILGDDTASFDPESCTLTLWEPTISGTASNQWGITRKIYAKDMDLTIAGSYQMTAAEGATAVSVEDGSLTLDGDFTFKGTDFGVSADDGLTVKSGTLNVSATSSSGTGIFVMSGAITIESGVTKVDATGATWAIGAFGGLLIDPSLTVTEPAGAVVNEMTVLSGETAASHVVIQGGAGGTGSLSGSVTSYLYPSEKVTVQLLQGNTVKMSTAMVGNSGSYSFTNLSAGSYTLRVSKKNHVTRDIAVTVSGNTTQNVKFNPLGDVNLDGKVTIRDVNNLYNHVKGSVIITDSYSLQCGDLSTPGNGVTIRDVNTLYNHVKGKVPLY